MSPTTLQRPTHVEPELRVDHRRTPTRQTDTSTWMLVLAAVLLLTAIVLAALRPWTTDFTPSYGVDGKDVAAQYAEDVTSSYTADGKDAAIERAFGSQYVLDGKDAAIERLTP